MTGALPSSIVAGISFIGRGGGQVKALGGFKKGHHTLPDAANATTNAFLGKICGSELAAQAEKLFQSVRAGLGYKRKDVSLSLAGPAAVLTAKDFIVEIVYALEESAPSRYAVTTTLHGLKNSELARTEKFERIFAAMFSEISIALKKGARVEAVIDIIEALEGEGGLGVSYPSDCSQCVIAAEGIEAQVRCSGPSLEIVFPRAGSPRDLMDGFAEIRGAFSVSRELAGLIGG
ncbi:MAG TPA: hypothetical protein VHO24_05745 [Opitutaceae bacterium]|nr:hypothetical protein [Opitutaceae bacterium]